jgi:phosphatidylserine decarboxylase
MIRSLTIAWQQIRPIFLLLLGSTLLSLWKRKWLAGTALGTLFLWSCYFFRDPDRLPADDDPNIIVSPADGRVQKIEVVEEPNFFEGQARRIIIFLSIFDVHVQRFPYAGEVVCVRYLPGSFAPAFADSADDNESNLIGLQTARGPLAVVQLTGAIARRIICRCEVGDRLARGERYGLIKFGSRVDLYLPLDVEVLVREGQRVAGGRTSVARWPLSRAQADPE